MPNLVKSINISEADKATLEGLLRQSTVEARIFMDFTKFGMAHISYIFYT